MKKTLVLGASETPTRYSHMAMKLLTAKGHEVVAIGKKVGIVDQTPIHKGFIEVDAIDTVTLYLNPLHQQAFYEYICALHPKRVIFNPGTENPALEALLDEHGIDHVQACTLVMLHSNQY